VLYGTYARGRLMRSAQAREEAELLVSLVRVGWGQANPAFRRVFTTLFVPEATPEQMDWFDELQRVSTSPETAARIRRARAEVDVMALASRVAVTTSFWPTNRRGRSSSPSSTHSSAEQSLR
jgi:hypothetical protein